jgi:hypothetical protein
MNRNIALDLCFEAIYDANRIKCFIDAWDRWTGSRRIGKSIYACEIKINAVLFSKRLSALGICVAVGGVSDGATAHTNSFAN